MGSGIYWRKNVLEKVYVYNVDSVTKLVYLRTINTLRRKYVYEVGNSGIL